MALSATQHTPDPSAVLAKAVMRAASQLGLRQAEVGKVLGLHRTAVSRLNRNGTLDPASKEGELALLLVRLGRSLFALTGGDEAWIRHFMQSPNTVTGGVPAEQVLSVQGLVDVLHFVDSLRGKT